MIEKPITEDGDVGYDQFGQLMHRRREGDYTVVRGVADVRGKVCAICAHGWRPDGPSFGDQRYWDLIGETVHESCLVRHSGLVDRALVYDAFVGARVRFEIVPIDNQYYAPPDAWHSRPWYHVRLREHADSFVVGVRKRVWSIEVYPTSSLVKDDKWPFRERPESTTRQLAWWERARARFKLEDVTKSFEPEGVTVHAWGAENMRRYIKDLVDVGGYRYRLSSG